MTDHRIAHRWRIVSGTWGKDTQVFIDDKPMLGVRGAKADFPLDDVVTLKLEVLVERLEIEGVATEKNPIILVKESAFAEREPAHPYSPDATCPNCHSEPSSGMIYIRGNDNWGCVKCGAEWPRVKNDG